MIISSFQDLPRDICLICGKMLKLSVLSSNPSGTYFCGEDQGWLRGASHYGISFHGATIDISCFQLDINPCNFYCRVIGNDKHLLKIDLIELDFSDISKLKKKLETLMNFS